MHDERCGVHGGDGQSDDDRGGDQKPPLVVALNDEPHACHVYGDVGPPKDTLAGLRRTEDGKHRKLGKRGGNQPPGGEHPRQNDERVDDRISTPHRMAEPRQHQGRG